MAQYRFLVLSAALLVLIVSVAEYGTMSMELPNANQTSAAMMAESPDDLDRQGSGASNVLWISIRIQVSNGCSTAGRCGGMNSGRCNNYCDQIGYNYYECTPHYCKCCRMASACD